MAGSCRAPIGGKAAGQLRERVSITRTPEWSARDRDRIPRGILTAPATSGDGADDETTCATIEAIKRLDAAFDRGDIDAFMAEMTDDCVWESFTPAPDGQRHEGQAAVRQAMADFLSSSPVVDGEEMLACGDRATVRWACRFDGGHVRESTSCGSAAGRSPRFFPM